MGNNNHAITLIKSIAREFAVSNIEDSIDSALRTWIGKHDPVIDHLVEELGIDYFKLKLAEEYARRCVELGNKFADSVEQKLSDV